MPRGDHLPGCCPRGGNLPCKRIGEPRQKKRGWQPPQPPHATLEARINSWTTIKHPLDSKRRHDGEGNTYRKPGSQRKGNR